MTRAWRWFGFASVLWLLALVVYWAWEILRRLP